MPTEKKSAGRSSAPASGDALSLLRDDHATVLDLFEQEKSLSEGSVAKRRELFRTISEELRVHARIEELIFYPALKEKTEKKSEERDEVLEAYEEHVIVKSLIAALEAMEPDDESYKAKMTVLRELVEHHIEDEESDIFEQARALGTKRLEQLGNEMLEMKESELGKSEDEEEPAFKANVMKASERETASTGKR